MSLKDDAWPSSAAFDLIAEALTDEANRKDAMKVGTVFGFILKNAQKEEKEWRIDLKQSGTIIKDPTDSDNKAEVTLILSDDEFAKLIAGKANAQKLFMSGKLKIKGNVMKATKIEPVLKKVQNKAKL